MAAATATTATATAAAMVTAATATTQQQQQQQQQQQSLRAVGTFRFPAYAFTNGYVFLPPILGGKVLDTTCVPSRTQTSRPITLGHRTSWKSDYGGDHTTP